MQHLSSRSLGRARGVTLIEVLIVVAIMALISVGVGFVVIKQMERARIQTTTVRAKASRNVAIAHVALSAGDCPTTDELIERGDLEEDNRVDAWDEIFTVTCEGHKIFVHSPGPDRVHETADDIIVPASMRPQLASGR